ncbi:MAG: hypothetical protein M5U01_29020 [Ardenticatenaceae bacterium]|nr:hypothetical protein [Ardenticatenaceae bacterium]HBY92508.1 hypothetical protein [Chloroflexota bacterium]
MVPDRCARRRSRYVAAVGLLVAVASLSLSFTGAHAAGPTWHNVGPWGGWGSAVALSPNFVNDRTIFVGARKGGIYKSTDGGQHFVSSLQPASAADLEVFSIEFSPGYASDGTLFATTRAGVWRSQDRGQNWQQVYAASAVTRDTYYWHVAISPNFQSDGLVMVASQTEGVLRSISHGDPGTWSPSNSGISTLAGFSIAIAKDAPDVAFYGSTARVYRSQNGGQSWTQMAATGLGAAVRVYDITISPHYTGDGHVYLGTAAVNEWGDLYYYDKSAYVWKSTDGGATFAQLPMNGDDFSVKNTSDYLTVALPADYDGTDSVPDIVIAGRPSWSPFRSDDGGNTWRRLVFPDVDGSRVLPDTYDVALSPDWDSTGNGPQRLAAAVHGTGLFLSEDGGWNWTAANQGMYGHWLNTVKVADDGTVFVASLGGGIYRSDDGGATWTLRNDDSAARVLGLQSATALAIAPNFAGTQKLVIGTAYGEWDKFYHSEDGGLNWTPADQNRLDGCAASYDGVFTNANTVFIGTWDGICRSTDGGVSWSKIALRGQGVHSLAVASDGTMFAGTLGQGVSRSTDGGATWVSSGLSGEKVWQIAISPNYASDHTVFAAMEYPGGVYRSTNGGAAWSQLYNGWTKVRGIAVSPRFAIDRTLWIAPYPGDIQVSIDGGTNWTPTGLPFGEPTRLGLAAGSGSGAAVFAITQGLGLWQYGDAPTACVHPHDFNHSGVVDAEDILVVSDAWGTRLSDPGFNPAYDLVPDNLINLLDIQMISAEWNETCTPQ